MKTDEDGKSLQKTFHLIFWGLLLVILNLSVSLNGFTLSLFPDFVGYAMMAIACGRLRGRSQRFAIAMGFGWAMSAVSITSYFFENEVLQAMTSTFDSLLIWYLLSGILDDGLPRLSADQLKLIKRLRVLYPVTAIGATLLTEYSPYSALLGVALTIGNLVVTVVILYLLWTLGPRLTSSEPMKELEPGPL